MTRTILQDMPCSVRGFTRKSEDDYTIVLNSRLAYEANVHTYVHEVGHILDDDFSKHGVDQIERRAHGGEA